MKLVCTIGTQGLPDGRRIPRGDVYEVDDETASTLVAARYAMKYVKPVVEDVVDTTQVVDSATVVDEPVVVDETATSVKPAKSGKIDNKKKTGRR